MPRHYVVLPAFNEGKVIREVIESTLSAFKQEGILDVVLVIVNDGSSDNTGAVLGALAGDPQVLVLEHRVNRGLGAAVQTGLAEASKRASSGDIILSNESDGTQSPRHLVELARCIGPDCNLAVATPLAEDGAFRGVKWYRRILSRGANLIYSILFPVKGLSDYTNLVRAIDADLLATAIRDSAPRPLLTKTGFEAVPELVIKLRRVGIKSRQIPLEIDHTVIQRSSSMNVIRTICRSLWLCVQYKTLDFFRFFRRKESVKTQAQRS